MSSDSLTIRRADSCDAEDIAAISAKCFDEAWTADGLRKDIGNDKVSFYLAAEHTGSMIGYMGSWMILEEAHVITVGVDPEFRNRKVASTMMLCFFREAVRRGVHWSTLEVDEDNLSAIRLYEKFGYKTVSVRKNYYGEGRDGLLMWLGGMHNASFSERLDEIEKDISPEGWDK